MAKTIKNPKAKKGQTVLFGGEKHKVTSVTFISNPEFLIGGKRGKEGYYYQLDPIDKSAEEPDGWISERLIKRVRKKRR